jgi:tetratricopeptide (TPR) repeat protein
VGGVSQCHGHPSAADSNNEGGEDGLKNIHNNYNNGRVNDARANIDGLGARDGHTDGSGGSAQSPYSAPSSSPASGGDGGGSLPHPSPGGVKRYHPEPALAVLFDRYGGVDTALQVLTRTTAQSGNDPVMWSDLGNAYRVKGDSDRAIECFESALRLQAHPDFFLNLGGVRFVLGEVDEAIRLFTLGLQMNPRHVLLQFSMGNAFAMLGRKEEAARSFEATLRIQPDFTAAEQYLRTLRRDMQTQWWPSRWLVVAAALFVVACAGVQRTVQFYAMGGYDWYADAGTGDRGIARGGDVVTGGAGSVGAARGVATANGMDDRSGASMIGSILRRIGVGGGNPVHLNEAVGHGLGGGVKQRRKRRLARLYQIS